MALSTLNRSRNEMVLENLEEGDLIEIHRGKYSHWAIYNGNRKVIHLTGLEDEAVVLTRSCVIIEPFWDVVGDSEASKKNQHDAYSPRKILWRAESRLGPVHYSMNWNNSEDFVSWCSYGENISEHADMVPTGYEGLEQPFESWTDRGGPDILKEIKTSFG